MFRKSGLALSLLGSLALALVACQASFQAGSGANEPAPAPPPPPPPAASAPAAQPAATTAAEPAATPATTTTPQTATEPDLKVKRGRLEVPGNIVFDTGKSSLQAGSGSEAVLGQVKTYLDKNPRVTKLRVEGHTDFQGDAEANIELSGQRSKTVKQWLVDHGVDAGRLLAVGFGSQKPVADNATEEGRAQNRRTEFHVAEMDGKKFLGRNPNGGGKVFE